MSALEIGQKMVELCKEGKNLEALNTLFAEDAESIEARGDEQMPAEMKGLDALRQKNQWFFDNHEVHRSNVKGPFPNGDRFTVVFSFDVTPKAGPMAGKRMQMEEVGLYTVEGGKITREEFFYGDS
jgi:ketosteroid isomerase-like protein